jgi:cytochrome c
MNHSRRLVVRAWTLIVAATAFGAASGACAASAGSAGAVTPEMLLAQAGCSMCHALDHKIIGPSYHDIALRYVADGAASSKLADKVRSGGRGSWGPVDMPPTDPKKLSDAQIKTVVAWILRQTALKSN